MHKNVSVDSTIPKTRRQILDAFETGGLKVSDWAREHGFKREHVYAVLSGRVRGRWGEAHAVAVALGLKRGPPTAASNSNTEPMREESV